jgi:hypothetical protein
MLGWGWRRRRGEGGLVGESFDVLAGGREQLAGGREQLAGVSGGDAE